MANTLTPGQVRSGQLVDGLNDTPFQSCTLTYQEGRGALLHVPYFAHADQFKATVTWFKERQPPASLTFHDQDGAVAFTGLRWLGHSGSNFVLGKIGPDVAIFGRPRSMSSDYKVRRFLSRIDGLWQFTAFTSIDEDTDYIEGRYRMVVTVDAKDEVKWRHGGFTYTLRALAPWTSTSSMKFNAESDAEIETSAYRGASIDDHLTAQWPLRALLLLVHGRKLFWRDHHLIDDHFPTWMTAGPPREPGGTSVQLRRTIRDAEQPKPDEVHTAYAMFHLRDIGPSGLKRWCALYDDPAFRRAIEPVVEVINGASRFLEPQVMMTALGLDAMGYYRDPDRRRNTRLAAQIERCMVAVGVDYSKIGPIGGIASAIANVNNEIKHPDRLVRPDSLQLSLIADLSMFIARTQLFDLLRLPEKTKRAFLNSLDFNNLVSFFELNDLRIDDAGGFVSRSSGNPPSDASAIG